MTLYVDIFVAKYLLYLKIYKNKKIVKSIINNNRVTKDVHIQL
jgi:hypothetical protein